MLTKLKTCNGCNLLKPIWKSDGKEKYCKQCWYGKHPPKKITSTSRKMRGTNEDYIRRTIPYLAIHSRCQAHLPNCTYVSTEVHHKSGRREHHNDETTWLAVCRTCHVWIELHPKEAKDLGFSNNRLT